MVAISIFGDSGRNGRVWWHGRIFWPRSKILTAVIFFFWPRSFFRDRHRFFWPRSFYGDHLHFRWLWQEWPLLMTRVKLLTTVKNLDRGHFSLTAVFFWWARSFLVTKVILWWLSPFSVIAAGMATFGGTCETFDHGQFFFDHGQNFWPWSFFFNCGEFLVTVFISCDHGHFMVAISIFGDYARNGHF